MYMTKMRRDCLEFLSKCEGWVTYSKDMDTVKTVRQLENAGYVQTNQFHQVKLIINPVDAFHIAQGK